MRERERENERERQREIERERQREEPREEVILSCFLTSTCLFRQFRDLLILIFFH